MKKNILFLTTKKLLPANYGGAIYSLGVLRYIASTGANIDLVSFVHGEKYTNLQEEELKTYCNNIYSVSHKFTDVKLNFSLKYPNTIRKYIRNNMKQILKQLNKNNKYDIVIFDHLQMADYVKIFNTTKNILIEHNVESRIWDNYTENCKSIIKPIIKYNAKKILEYEKNIITLYDMVIALTEEDKKELKRISHYDNIVVMKPYMVIDAVKKEEDFKKIKKNLLFIGSYDWYPNQNAAKFLINEVMPLLREKREGVTLYLVGKDPTIEMLDAASKFKDIVITGKVDSVDEYYEKCDIMINAIEDGSGINIKVVEAMAKGIPILSSEYGLRGFEHNKTIASIYINVEDCVEKISTLMKDASKLRELHNSGLNYYKEFIKPTEEVENIFK